MALFFLAPALLMGMRPGDICALAPEALCCCRSVAVQPACCAPDPAPAAAGACDCTLEIAEQLAEAAPGADTRLRLFPQAHFSPFTLENHLFRATENEWTRFPCHGNAVWRHPPRVRLQSWRC